MAASDRPIDDLRRVKVICIGAGVSGILAGIRLPQKVKNLDLTILEKNDDIGGTWYENKYPGVASDIPSHGYQYTFADNYHWDHFYASGAEVQAYLSRIVDTYGVRRYVKFGHLFKGATWLEEEGQWEVKVEKLENGEIFTQKAHVVIKATGILNTWRWPEIQGLFDFKGNLLHSARWDTSFDATNKSIAVIGSGSTGIQIVPALQPIAGHIFVYSRSKAWVSPRGPFAAEIEKRGGNENFEYSTEEKEAFARDPEAYAAYRRQIDSTFLKLHPSLLRGSEAYKKGSHVVEDLVRKKLESRPDIFAGIKPEYPVGCKRLGAGPGYLEALCKDNVSLISTGIKEVTADGILDIDGVFRPVDSIICATGFDTTLNNHAAPIYGQHGISLDDVWTPEVESYLGVCAAKMPNLFFTLGPNGAPFASMILMIEFQMEYIIKSIQKIQREYIKSMVVSERAKNGFVKVADAYFAKTVLTDNCASWFKSKGKADGRIQTMWPGSLGHARYTYSNPRWEDFAYELLPDLDDNPLGWLGDGSTLALVEGGNLTEYLDEVDIPPVVNEKALNTLDVNEKDLSLPVI